ncbi:MAG TPA: DNA polymerase I [Anaerolineaceae bacterium]|nr:DNA polymerase I [Anaerolineaceae bacterium]
MPKILYLLDGHAIAYRSYFALTSGGSAHFTTSKGEPTAGVFGFAGRLIRLFEQEEPDYVAVSFDTGRTFRHEMYADYKGTRAKMPDDLRVQIERIREMVDDFNIPRIEIDNYEADDVIGSLARWATEEKGLVVKIITGDRDLLQLVTNSIVVSLPDRKNGQDKDYFPEDVLERMGVRPDQIVDYKALVGDPSDNIPGVRGIGDKTAIELLEKYDTLDNIYAHLDEIKGRAFKPLSEGREAAYLSQDLARIRTDLPVLLDLEQAKPALFDPGKVEDLFEELEFRTLTKRLKKMNARLNPSMQDKNALQSSLFPEEDLSLSDEEDALDLPFKTAIVLDEGSLEACVNELKIAKQIAFDTETTGLDPMLSELVGISLAANPDKGYYIPVGHEKGSQLGLGQIRKALQPILTDPKIEKVAHNAKFDLVVLHQAGFAVDPITFDTMIAEWLISPNSHNLGLKAQAFARLGVQMTEIEELIGKGKSQITMAQVPIEKAAPYAAADAVMTLRLVKPMTEDLIAHVADKLYLELENPLIPILADMEEAGISLDGALFKTFSAELTVEVDRLTEQACLLAGEVFNLNSTQQLSDILFEKLALEPPDRSRRTSSGKYSTSAEVLESMRGLHPLVDIILEYRELSKLRSTYVDALPTQVNPHTGRVHTTFNQTGTVTGRIASQNPNLQNIPIRTELGRKVRQGFIAAPGHKLLAVDYSQIELRIVAHMAKDEAMIKAFKEGQDVHAATAAAIENVPLSEVTKQQRRHAKAINFGLIYGMSPFGLTRTTDLTLAEAENFVKEYFREFPGVKKWLDNTRLEATRQGYVETLLGRRRYFPALASGTSYTIRQRMEREAINAPVQGTAADIIKLAMIRLPEAIKNAGLKTRMILQVHDELIFEVPEAELEEATKLVTQVMESALELSVPLLTEARVGHNWAELTVVDADLPVIIEE